MFRHMPFAALMAFSTPAIAQGDEIDPVPAHALIGHPYFSESTPAQILFINVRAQPVRILWIAFDGSERLYDELTEAQQVAQPTYVAHRWLVRNKDDDAPLVGFISTRAAARSTGTPQIAIIR